MRAAVLLALLLAASVIVAEEPVDRIAARVNRAVILESEVEEALRAESLIEGRSLASLTDADLDATLNRLIDQHLLESEMMSIGIDPPAETEIALRVAEIRRQHPGSQDENRWRALLAEYGIDQQALEARVTVQLEMMSLLDVRLRPNVIIEGEAVEEYYRKSFVPELQAKGVGHVPALREVEAQIREVIVQQRVSELLDIWLHNLRQQASIVVSQPDVQPVAAKGQ